MLQHLAFWRPCSGPALALPSDADHLNTGAIADSTGYSSHWHMLVPIATCSHGSSAWQQRMQAAGKETELYLRRVTPALPLPCSAAEAHGAV